MGVPKFFRYISERYPCLSSMVKDYEIPDFDNLYLDMNGIIHPCSHPNDDDDDTSDNLPLPSLSQEQIFQNIFNYLEQLFRLIKPKKLFFMAVDGVAPRAKMNQQRSRRFRTATAAIAKKMKREQAAAAATPAGVTRPVDENGFIQYTIESTTNDDESNPADTDENQVADNDDDEATKTIEEFDFMSVQKKRRLIKKTINKAANICFDDDYFDSNCITPGTKFMANLHEKLIEFIQLKIGHDPLWKNVKVILSGHNTPGEGEHKIMDYIRYLKSTTKNKSKIKHCLYGLDADLIILGLCTHEYNFCLLREEVKFGRKAKRSLMMSSPEYTRFYLLHLTLLREYLEIEFSPLKKTLVTFEFDLEKIIDDWVLLGFLVGNDFVPNLPNLHISNNVLPRLYKLYMECLPKLDGYINESGTLNLPRFEKFMKYISKMDFDHFDNIFDDLLYMEMKTGVRWDPSTASGDTQPQKTEAEENTDNQRESRINEEKDDVPNLMDQYFKNDNAGNEDNKQSEGENEESELMLKYFEIYKRKYYLEKLEIEELTPEILKKQAQDYVCALQWILNYYYTGICSWSWYYAHHYAPFISDIKDFAVDMENKMHFDLGRPFKPFEQLLAVLPPASKACLPEPYHYLILNKDSPLIEYYPDDYQTDLNGKLNDWEAVVLLPFIDETLLLKAMEPCNKLLTVDEIHRNEHGPMVLYEYDGANKHQGQIKATPLEMPKRTKEQTLLILKNSVQPRDSKFYYSPGFPTLKLFNFTHELQKAKVRVFDQPSRYENVILTIQSNEKEEDIKIPFHLLGATVYADYPHLVEAKLISISSREKMYIYQGSPVREADNNGEKEKSNYRFIVKDTSENDFKNKCSSKTVWYKERLGVNIVNTNVVCEVQFLIGKKYAFPSTTGGKENKEKLVVEKQYSKATSHYPLQIIVTKDMLTDQEHEDDDNIYADGSGVYVTDIFPKDSICFLLCNPNYGYPAMVLNNSPDLNGRIQVNVLKPPNEDHLNFKLAEEIETQQFMKQTYRNLFHSACQLGMSNYIFSRITGSLYLSVTRNDDGEYQKKLNIGLQLKLPKQNKETPGYTRRVSNDNNINNNYNRNDNKSGGNNSNNYWYYSEKCVKLVRDYSTKFPEIFEYLSRLENNDNDKYGNGGSQYYAEDIFGSDQCTQKMEDLKRWLQKIPTKSIERQYPNCYLADETVECVENILNRNKELSQPVSQIIMKIKPCFLYRPQLSSDALLPDPSMTDVQLYDRIIHVRMGSVVPFALKGIVVGIVPPSQSVYAAFNSAARAIGNDLDTMYDIVFDEPFQQYGVGTVEGSANSSRRYRLSKSTFLNISLGRRNFEKKTGKSSTTVPFPSSATADSAEKLFKRLARELSSAKTQKSHQILPAKQLEWRNSILASGSAFASFPNNNNNSKVPVMAPEKDDGSIKSVPADNKDISENKEKSDYLKSLLNISSDGENKKEMETSINDAPLLEMTVPPNPPETWMIADQPSNNKTSKIDSTILSKLFIPTQVMKKSGSSTANTLDDSSNTNERNQQSAIGEKNRSSLLGGLANDFENLKVKNDDLLRNKEIATSHIDIGTPSTTTTTIDNNNARCDEKSRTKRKSRIAAKFNTGID